MSRPWFWVLIPCMSIATSAVTVLMSLPSYSILPVMRPSWQQTVTDDVAIDMQGINTQNQGRDTHLRSADFFDVANHPQLTFKSKRVEPGAAGHFKLVGDLTIRGNTKEVVLDVEGPSPVVKGPRGVLTGASATTKISRKEFGVLWNNLIEAMPVVGDEVSITIDLELNRPAMPGTQQ